jgi:hypothetical protein
MSKVKLTGHSSGTGVLTVTSPDTDTDRTITLPDATGTLLNSDGDGSSLTGITTDTTTIENNIALLGFYRASDNSVAKYNLVDQVIDEYTDATGIDAGNSTNESLTSGVYSGVVQPTTYSTLTLTEGNLSQDDLSAWEPDQGIDDDTDTWMFHTDTADVGAWVKYDFGAAGERAVRTWRYHIDNSAAAIWQLQYSSDDTNWTDVGSTFGGHHTSGGEAWYDSGIVAVGTEYRYWRTYKTDVAGSGNYHNQVEIIAYDAQTAGGDLTLQSVATTAESAPTTGDIVILIEDGEGTATINTDIKAYISRDGSAFSSAVTLTDEGDWGTNKRILAAHDVDISGITSGTSMKYKITTHNQSAGSKETKIHATSLAWA